MSLTNLLCLIILGNDVASGGELHRQRLPVNLPTLIQHLQTQHSSGNRNSHFTISVGASDGEAGSSEWRLHMQEIPLDRLAIPPSANLSVYGRHQQVVGDLGYSYLSVDTSQDKSAHEGSYAFLIVDWNSNTLSGVLAKQDKVVYIDDQSSIFVEPPSNDAIWSSPDMQYQITISLQIDQSLVRQIGGGSLCHTISYLNSLFTAANEVLMVEVQTRLIVNIVNQTSLDGTLEGIFNENVASLASSSHTDVQRIDMTYIFLNSDGIRNTQHEKVCGLNPGFGIVTSWNGNAINWGDGWWMDLSQLLELVGQNLGLKATDAESLLRDHISSLPDLLPTYTFDGIRSFLATSQEENSCLLIPNDGSNTNSEHYERTDCPSIISSEYTKMTDLAPVASTSPSAPTGPTITNSPSILTANVSTNSPTEDLFKTFTPTSKPTNSPTTSEQPSSPGDGLPTATVQPTTEPPAAPPTAPFPTYKPTDGTSSPTTGDETYSPTEKIDGRPTKSPTLSPSSAPSIMPSSSIRPSKKNVPSSSLMPSEIHRPSASPSQSLGGPSVTTMMPSFTPSAAPSSSLKPSELYKPSAFPSRSSVPSSSPIETIYNRQPTNSIANKASTVLSFGCPSPPPDAVVDLVFDGTTDEFVCDTSGSLNGGRSLEETAFFIEPTNPSIVEKLRIYANNDCSGCDPVEYTLKGWADQWVEISSGALPWKDEDPPRNNETSKSIQDSTYEHGDDSLSYTEVTFENTIPYSQYLLAFPVTRDNSFGLAVAEAELPGVEFEPIPTDAPVSPTSSKPPTSRSKKPTPKPQGTKTSKTPRPTIKSRRTRKPTKRPKNTKSSKSYNTKSSKNKSAGYPSFKWDDIFAIDSEHVTAMDTEQLP